jgi:hypothetical protein
MPFLSEKVLPIIEEDEATDEVAQIYETIKRDLQMPFVPNMLKALGR